MTNQATWQNKGNRKKMAGPLVDGPSSGFTGGGNAGNKPKGGNKNAYTVQAGDSPALIAQKLYGDQRYLDIVLAQLGGSMLQAGMKLKLPDLRKYQKDLAASGQLHEVTQGEWAGAQAYTARTNYGQRQGQPQAQNQGGYNPSVNETPATSSWSGPNLWDPKPYTVNPPPQYAAASGVPPVGYGPNAYGTPQPPAVNAPKPPLNYAALAAQNVSAPKPLSPSGAFNLSALPSYQPPEKPPIDYARGWKEGKGTWMLVPDSSGVLRSIQLSPAPYYTGIGMPSYQRPAISSGRTNTQPTTRKQQLPPPPPTQLTGIPPLQDYNPAQPGAATGYYTGIGLQPYAAAVRTGAGLGAMNPRDPRDTLNRMDKPTEQGPGIGYLFPVPPPGYIPPAPVAGGGPFYPQPYGGGGPGRRGGGGGGNPRGGVSRGAGGRGYQQPIYAQNSNMPGGGRNIARDQVGLSRTGLVTWRL